EVVEGPPSPDTSSTTLETTLHIPETTFASLETASATPDTSLDTLYTAPSTLRTNPSKSSFPVLSFKFESKSESSKSSDEVEAPSETGSVAYEPEDGDSFEEHKNEDEEGSEEKGEELEGESEESEGLEEGKEGEEIEKSEEVEEVDGIEESEEAEKSEEEHDQDVDSGAAESSEVATFEGEDSVLVPNEEPSTLPAGKDPIPVGIPVSTDAPAAVTEAPAIMEAAQMVEQGQVVELEEAPVANEESSNVAHGEPAASTAIADTPGAMGDLPGSTTPGALESRKRPSDEFEGERKKSEGLEGEEGEEAKESGSVGESEEIEGEEENNHDVGSGVAESKQVSASAVEHSVPVPNEEPSTLPAGSSVPVPANMSASTDATAAVTGAPAVTEAAQTAEQGQVVVQEEAPVTNEEPTDVPHGEEGSSTAAVDTPGPTGDLSGSPIASNLEKRKRPLDDGTTGMRKRARPVESLPIGYPADTPTTVPTFAGGEVVSSSVNQSSVGHPAEPETTRSAPASSALSNSSADAPGLPASLDALAPTEPPTHANTTMLTGPSEVRNPTPESNSAFDASATVVLQGQQAVTSTAGQVLTSSYVQESHLVNPAPYIAAYKAGYEAGLTKIAQYYAEQQTHGTQTIGGYGYQQQTGAPLATEGNVGHGGVWNGGQALAASGQAQATDVAIGLPVSIPHQLTDASVHSPGLEHRVNVPEVLNSPTLIHAPVSALLPVPLIPTSASVSIPIPPPQRGSRVSVPKNKPNPKENQYGVRPPLLHKPLKKTHEATATLDGANIAYHGRVVWQAALDSVFRTSFPDRQDTGFVPRCSVPAIPCTWIPRSAEAIAKDTESPATGTPQTTIAEAPS
ncbi:hypothetical protein FRC07_010834, partial [Ceratobasidium sp. 392]